MLWMIDERKGVEEDVERDISPVYDRSLNTLNGITYGIT